MVIQTKFADICLPVIFLASALVLFSVPSVAVLIPISVPVFLPVGLVLIGILLGWRFGQSNIALGLFALLLSYLALKETGLRTDKDLFWQIVYAGLTILLPLNLLFFSFLEERGLFSYWGILRLGFLLGQAGGLYWITVFGNEAVHATFDRLFHYRLLPASIDTWTSLPQPSLIFYLIAALALTAQLALSKSSTAGAFLGALIATALAFHFLKDPDAVDLFMTTAIVIFTVMILQVAYRMAFVDELTGIPGRRALLMDMKKLRSPYVIAMGDIDHFKKFNDTYGHDIGDQVLRMVAAQLSRIGGGGKVYRYGGEEFTILLPGKNKSARKYLEEIRQRVEQSAFHIRDKDRPKAKPKGKAAKSRGRTVKVTVSIGFADSGGKKQKPDRVLKAADQALYRAKNAGRNQVSL